MRFKISMEKQALCHYQEPLQTAAKACGGMEMFTATF